MVVSKHATCPNCGEVMLKKNLWSHLKVVHYLDEEEVSAVRENMKKEGGVAKVACPLCDELFPNYEGLAKHCYESHSEDGAGGHPQDYSVFSIAFTSQHEYELWLKEKYSDGSVSVEGCFGHVGHQLDPALIRQSAQRDFYPRTLPEEHSMEYIVGELQEVDPTTSGVASVGASPTPVEGPVITEEQKREEIRFQKVNTIKMKLNTLISRCTRLIRIDTDGAVQVLDEVDAYVDLANAALNAFEMGGLITRPEMTQPTQPKLSQIPFHWRSTLRKPSASEGEDILSEG
ncbi:unnamed protein product [Nippostrongylus brasiliensis]|uniref:C2H2-type domain-containing protein n=1 Tax=Nippostrongylus brasiliensis TaxID=27835 RepID=A0A0N4YAU7_NIPBR|nr:unnamed protein product [Nippostrongylus brasiliensis]